MYKGLSITATLILLLASVSLAEIQQGQGVGIGGFNNVILVDGPGVASSTNFNTAEQMQDSSGSGGLVTAMNFQVGVLGQAAGIGGMGGVMSIVQDGSGILNQAQAQAGTNLGVQGQTAFVGLTDSLTKLGGVGAGIGLQLFMGAQVQAIASPFGINVNVNIPVARTLQVAHY